MHVKLYDDMGSYIKIIVLMVEVILIVAVAVVGVILVCAEWKKISLIC